jgi:hypothetical protein
VHVKLPKAGQKCHDVQAMTENRWSRAVRAAFFAAVCVLRAWLLLTSYVRHAADETVIPDPRSWSRPSTGAFC